MTVTPEHRFEVSAAMREEFENGRDYYALRGKPIQLPGRPDHRPSREHLIWHNEAVFRG